MTLIVEDGTGVVDANTYVTSAETRAYADLRGAALPVDDAELEPLIVVAADWVDSYRLQFQSRKTQPEYPRQFPRYRVVTDRYVWPGDTIPDQVKAGQMQAVVDQASGNSLTATGGAQVKREKVAVIEVEYFEKKIGTIASTGGSPTAEKLLEPLFRSGSIGFGVSAERI